MLKFVDMIRETKCVDGWEDNPRARCRDCFSRFEYSPWNTYGDIYKGRYVCPSCDENYGYCNECGKYMPYEKMNDEIYCGKCVKGGK